MKERPGGSTSEGEGREKGISAVVIIFGERASTPVQVTVMASCQILLMAAGTSAGYSCDQAHRRLENK